MLSHIPARILLIRQLVPGVVPISHLEIAFGTRSPTHLLSHLTVTDAGGQATPDQMTNQDLSEQYASAQELEEAQPQQAISKLRDVLLGEQANDADSIKVKEQALQSLANLYAKQHDASSLRNLLTDLRPLFALIPKAKTAKIVRTVIDTIAKVPNSTGVQVRGATYREPASIWCQAFNQHRHMIAVGGLQGAGAVGPNRKAHLSASAN